jgi:hypothetical protein
MYMLLYRFNGGLSVNFYRATLILTLRPVTLLPLGENLFDSLIKSSVTSGKERSDFFHLN